MPESVVDGVAARMNAGDAVVGVARRAAEDEEIARAKLHIGPRLVPAGGVAEPEHTGVAKAERDDRIVGPFVLVLVQARSRGVVVEVDQRGVGTVPIGRFQVRRGDGVAS